MRRKKQDSSQERGEWPAVVYLWAFGLTILSYAAARIVLDAQPHPVHWLAAVAGAVAGIPVGWAWYRWRWDVF